MKSFLFILLISSVFSSQIFSQVIKKQVSLESPNARCWIWNTGVFDQDMRVNNTPGFEWPLNSGKFANFTCGLSIAGLVNGNIRTACASYNGEYCPGYVIDSAGHPKPRTDSTFRHYKIIKGDNAFTNYDWMNWGRMVPYGAPYIDVNNNGIYEPLIDTPGVKNALQTVFICMTDAFPGNHTNSEGLPGGTLPMNAEIHLTAWTYPYTQTQDAQFFKWDVINKNDSDWNKCYFSYFTDLDLGEPHDDYCGTDTTLRLGYGYNADNNDGTGSGNSYGVNPPAYGLLTLKSPVDQSNFPLKYNFNVYFKYPTVCDYDPNTPAATYNMFRGVKRDGSNHLDPTYFPPKPTKVCFPGNPETVEGWTCYNGRITNCGGLDTGSALPIAYIYSYYLSFGQDDYNFHKGETNSIILAQLMSRGANNRNSVTKLKQFSQYLKDFYNNNYTIGVNQLGIEVPAEFSLHQNYPNPFNPSTKIFFDLPKSQYVTLNLYDINGRLIKLLYKNFLQAGEYSYDFNEPALASGVYFYSLITEGNSVTKKMMLLK
ncbi:MAG: T9SS type A sorting domain-containing protein [Bacteroidetes bacterium]|nr:T9SS type A sorting domain-containing protein [Bacteroidota bacterium]